MESEKEKGPTPVWHGALSYLPEMTARKSGCGRGGNVILQNCLAPTGIMCRCWTKIGLGCFLLAFGAGDATLYLGLAIGFLPSEKVLTLSTIPPGGAAVNMSYSLT